MSGKSYVYRRDRWYYFRFYVPQSLVEQWGDTCFRISLQTESLQKARSIAILLHPFARKLIDQAKGCLVDKTYIMGLIKEKIKEILATNEAGFNASAACSPRGNPDSMLKDYDRAIGLLQNCLKYDAYAPIAPYFGESTEIVDEAGETAPGNGIPVPPDDENYQWALRTFTKALMEAYGIARQRLEGNYNNGYDQPILAGLSGQGTGGQPIIDGMAIRTAVAEIITPLMPPPPPPPRESSPLQPLIDRFCNERLASGNWTGSYTKESKAYLSMLTEYFGTNTDAGTINREMIVRLRDDVLKRLPKNRNKDPRLRDLTLDELLALPDAETIQVRTINKYLELFHQFFCWCQEYKIINEVPTGNLNIKNRERPRDQRKQYSKDELIRILQAVAPGYNFEAHVRLQDRLWIIVLAMFQGMRQNEICQIFTRDIIMVHGIPSINVMMDDDTLHTKTPSSDRIVPLHPVLLRLGFLDFVNRRRRTVSGNKSAQLFESMTYHERHMYTKNLKNFYGKFNRTITTDPKKTFHSFRHNFDTTMMNLGEPLFIVECLDGHKHKGETAGRYAKPQVEAMFKSLSKLDYGFNVFEILGATPLSDEEINRQKEQLPVFEN